MQNWLKIGVARYVQRIIDDGFGITKRSKIDFEHWVSEFNGLRETITIDKFKYVDEVDFMDLFIFQGEKFKYEGIFDVSIFQKTLSVEN